MSKNIELEMDGFEDFMSDEPNVPETKKTKKTKVKKIKGNQNLDIENVKIDKSEKISNMSEQKPNDFVSPVYNIKRVQVQNIHSNSWNPNSVAEPEMELLATSILEDGFTQPIVVSPDPDKEGYYILIDGAHRHILASHHEEINRREQGTVPCVVLDKSMPDRIASTIRHNKARGTHDVQVMSSIVKGLQDAGLGDDYIKRNLGMEQDELIKLKQISGLSSLFEDEEFNKAWIIE